MRQAQALHLIEALEHKGGLQVAPRDDWSAPRIRVVTDVMACLQALLLCHELWRRGVLTGITLFLSSRRKATIGIRSRVNVEGARVHLEQVQGTDNTLQG